MAKGKKVLFTYVIEILNGNGPKPGPFWLVLKKCHCHSLRKPKDPEEKTPVPQDKTPMTSYEAPADVQRLVAGENDVMSGVAPSAPTDSPKPPSLSPLPMHSPRVLPYMNTFISANPFPAGFDLPAMQQWMTKAEAVGTPHTIMGQIAEGAGLTTGTLMIYHEITLNLPCSITQTSTRLCCPPS
jgi:hypothetical protein